MADAVEVRGLAKTFRVGWPRRQPRVALREVSFTVPRGTIFGVLGPNGAGKTTLLSILATLLLPDAGEARVLGLDVVRDAARLRERVNLASGTAAFLWSLTPREILDIAGRAYGLRAAARRRRVEQLLAEFELGTVADLPYNELSTGFRQRLCLARAFVNDPEVLILDEPTVGLDPDVAARIRETVTELRRRDITILLSTHYMREAEQLCDDMVFLREGRVLARGDPPTLKRQILAGERLRMSVEGEAWRGLHLLPGVLAVTEAGGRVECVVDDAGKRLPEVLRYLFDRGAAVSDVSVHEPDLETVFMELAR